MSHMRQPFKTPEEFLEVVKERFTMTAHTERSVDLERCAAAVHDNFNFYQCSRRVKVIEGGVGWCRQHSPSYREKKRREQDTRFEEEREKRRWQFSCPAREVLKVIIADPRLEVRGVVDAILKKPKVREVACLDTDRGAKWEAEQRSK